MSQSALRAGRPKMNPRKKQGYIMFIMILPFLALVFMFAYLPLHGWLYALYDYRPPFKLFDCAFVGLRWFAELFSNASKRALLFEVLTNTFVMSGLGIAFSWLPMAFAILLMEIGSKAFKRVTQTLTTLPHFISWVLVYSMAFFIFNSDGLINKLSINKLGFYDNPILFLQVGGSGVWLMMWLWGTWKGLGWSAIMYIAGIASIDQELYEAAFVDGAGRFRTIWHITIPGLLPTYSATQNWDNIASKFNTDHSIAYGWWSFMASSVFARIDLTRRAPYAPVPVKGMVLNSESYNPFGMEDNAFAIGSGAKYPERIMEWYDWMASPEGILAVNGQVEGVTYEMIDGKPALTEFGLDSNLDKQAPAEMGGGTWSDGSCKQNYPLTHQDDPNELLNGSSPNSSLWESTLALNKNEYNTKWEETYGSNNPMKYFLENGYMIVTPSTDYTAPSEPSEIQTIRSQIREIFQPAGWQMIYAANEADFQRIWDEALAKLPDFGLEQLYEWDQQIVGDKFAAIDRVLSGN